LLWRHPCDSRSIFLDECENREQDGQDSPVSQEVHETETEAARQDRVKVARGVEQTTGAGKTAENEDAAAFRDAQFQSRECSSYQSVRRIEETELVVIITSRHSRLFRRSTLGDRFLSSQETVFEFPSCFVAKITLFLSRAIV